MLPIRFQYKDGKLRPHPRLHVIDPIIAEKQAEITCLKKQLQIALDMFEFMKHDEHKHGYNIDYVLEQMKEIQNEFDKNTN